MSGDSLHVRMHLVHLVHQGWHGSSFLELVVVQIHLQGNNAWQGSPYYQQDDL